VDLGFKIENGEGLMERFKAESRDAKTDLRRGQLLSTL
jgi:hypothetical protein